jgi:MtN3 and saliva related transmembrane protein
MIMDTITLLGYIAGFFSTLSYLPQVIKSIRCRSTRDLSWVMLGMMITGSVLWSGYGLMVGQMPIMVTNGVLFVLITILIGVKIRFG